MNIYEMYYENGKRFKFYVRRKSWENTIAKIIAIENVEEGGEIPGKKPYHNYQKVTAKFYRGDSVKDCHQLNFLNWGELSCPNTYQYFLIKI
ncbi:hypothetical protein [Flexithrix dorotheae]|uniref:hypothetical protein n=1 Tax=Flexithrix dorotheae TaxID=70993 RepID=UPI0003621165|nr:hypothetical protein [Flexithrix dorotheae]